MPQATADDLDLHRAALTGHCYRMLGSIVDAEDAVQETLVRGFRGIKRFDGRAGVGTWLYRIATNVCLDMLADRARRRRSVDTEPQGTIHDELVERPREEWLEPVPGHAAIPDQVDPARRAILRQSIRLAFVAALQELPPKQRAALLLADVLGSTAAEIAATLDMTVAAVNSALQRARATLAARGVAARESALPEDHAALLERYVAAFERYDVDALMSLLREDATLSMPPFTLWLRGRDAIRAWLLGRGLDCRGSRLLPTAANDQPAFGQYRRAADGRSHVAWSLTVLEIERGEIAGWTAFLDTATLFPRFGLPLVLAASTPADFSQADR